MSGAPMTLHGNSGREVYRYQ